MHSSQHAVLQQYLQQFAQLSAEDIRVADDFWIPRSVAKREFFNFRNSVCRHVGFVVEGLFRVYYLDPETEEEHNLYFGREHTFLASLKSMVTQTVCPYSIEALEDSELLVIANEHLQTLYARSHGWERFGRLLAEQYLIVNQSRFEGLLTQTAEERYMNLLTNDPALLNRVSLGHISSYLGIKGPSLSRIRAQVGHK